MDEELHIPPLRPRQPRFCSWVLRFCFRFLMQVASCSICLSMTSSSHLAHGPPQPPILPHSAGFPSCFLRPNGVLLYVYTKVSLSIPLQAQHVCHLHPPGLICPSPLSCAAHHHFPIPDSSAHSSQRFLSAISPCSPNLSTFPQSFPIGCTHLGRVFKPLCPQSPW